MQTIQYQVTKEGYVVEIQNGIENEGFALAVSKGKIPTWTHRSSKKYDKLDESIHAQEIGVWYTYSGFPSVRAVKTCEQHVRNVFVRAGWDLTTSRSYEERKLAILIKGKK